MGSNPTPSAVTWILSRLRRQNDIESGLMLNITSVAIISSAWTLDCRAPVLRRALGAVRVLVDAGADSGGGDRCCLMAFREAIFGPSVRRCRAAGDPGP